MRAAPCCAAYTYAELRRDALDCAARFVALGLKKGDRLALVAETGPEFASLPSSAPSMPGCGPCRCRCRPRSAGAKPMSTNWSVQLASSDPALFLYPPELAAFAGEAALPPQGRVARLGQPRRDRPQPRSSFRPPTADEIAYLQYSSGSTRFPHGVAVTHRALLDNLRAHGLGLEVLPTDRCISWLPWYHDMGLVGCMLSPIANQLSVDYLKTEDFARRPLAWLDLISRNPGTTLCLLADLRLRHLLAPHVVPVEPAPTASTCRAGGLPATAPT